MKRARITLPIYNLGCGGGGTLAIERALTKVPGVMQTYVNPLTEMVYIVYDPDAANPEQLVGVIERIGYGAPRSKARHDDAATRKRAPARAWDGRRVVLLAGLLLVVIASLGVALDWLFPGLRQVSPLSAVLLTGLRSAPPGTMLVGLFAVFLVGALGVWGITAIYRTFSRRIHR